MSRIRLTQIRSTIKRPSRQVKTMEALGLRKINSSVEHNVTPQIMGMVDRVRHLLKVEELEA
ncbi:MAG: 50S ribosomal protein L30 [Flavobacteriia bacterium]|nr:MAG: 50S ribosomal protein L30 [Flavobacteriia bacterium]